MKRLPVIALSLLLAACKFGAQPEATATATDTVKAASVATSKDTATTFDDPELDDPGGDDLEDLPTYVPKHFPWMADSVRRFISLSDNALLQDYVKDSSVEFMYDHLAQSDGSTYVVVQIGADVDNGEGRIFSTAQWLFVDTLDHQIYFQPEEDSLVAWHK